MDEAASFADVVPGGLGSLRNYVAREINNDLGLGAEARFGDGVGGAGLRVAAGLGWQSLVGAELIVVSSGVGYLMVQGQSNLATDIVMSGMIAIGLVGFAIDVALRGAEARIRRGWAG